MGFIKYHCKVLSIAFGGAWAIANGASFILSILIGVIIWKYPAKESIMNPLVWIIPSIIFVAFLVINIALIAPYRIYKKQRQLIINLLKMLKSNKHKMISIETDEQYKAELLNIRNGVNVIKALVGDKFDELLLDKAARFLILKTIQNHNVGHNFHRYFSDIRTYLNFMEWLTGNPYRPDGLSDIQIGKYCYVLFLIYDKNSSDTDFHKQIIGVVVEIIFEHLSNAPLLVDLIVNEKLQYEDLIKECENPPQSKTEIIGRLGEYLDNIYTYLDAEGLLREENL